MPEAVDEKVAAVAGDHQSGATHLGERALRAFDLLVASGATDAAAVRDLARRLEEAQPAMASVRNISRMAAKVLLEQGVDGWPAFRDSMQREIDEGRRRVARNFVKLLDRPAGIVTLSRSANVFECIVLAHGRGLVREVVVLESRPDQEGLHVAKDLHEAGVPVVVAADAAAGALMGGLTMALVGADTVLADGSVVNKSGTYPLAALCRAGGRPLYVACEAFKIDTTRGPSEWRPPPDRDPHQLVPDLPARNPIFDLTPGSLVTGIVTDRGTYRPDQIRTVLGRA